MRRILARIGRRLSRPTETIHGYEDPELVDLIARKTAAYDPAAPLNVGAARTVLDFGGGSGRHYKEANSPNVRWAVVETATMVERASRKFATDKLRFFADVSSATKWLGNVELIHSNGALQYTDDPAQTVRSLAAIGAPEMQWFRLHFGLGEDYQVSLLSENGPGELDVTEKLVKYRRRAIPEQEFIAAHSGYKIAERGIDWAIFKF